MSYPETYVHEDHDGGRLTVDPSRQPYSAGIWVDSRECFVPLTKVAELVNAIWDRAKQSAHEQGKLPCPHPQCGPCSFDRAITEETPR